MKSKIETFGPDSFISVAFSSLWLVFALVFCLAGYKSHNSLAFIIGVAIPTIALCWLFSHKIIVSQSEIVFQALFWRKIIPVDNITNAYVRVRNIGRGYAVPCLFVAEKNGSGVSDFKMNLFPELAIRKIVRTRNAARQHNTPN